MNEPPLQTAELRAANLLSSGGMTVLKYSMHEVRILADCRVGVGEDYTFGREVFTQRTVDDFAFVLRLHAGQELLLGLGNAETIECLLDVGRNVFPVAALAVGRLDVIEDVLKVQVDRATPVRHRLRVENLEASQAELAHPLGLVLHVRDHVDDLGIESLAAFERVLFLVAEIVLVDFAEADVEVGFNVGGHDFTAFGRFRLNRTESAKIRSLDF